MFCASEKQVKRRAKIKEDLKMHQDYLKNVRKRNCLHDSLKGKITEKQLVGHQLRE